MVTMFDIEKFSYENNFKLWRIKIEVILIQQECADDIKGEAYMSTSSSQKEKIDMINKVKNHIILCLG